VCNLPGAGENVPEIKEMVDIVYGDKGVKGKQTYPIMKRLKT
jgi:hypothetical protein